MKRFLFTTILILCTCAVCLAQSERKSVRRGNRDFRKSQYEQAEIDYKKALLADSTSAAAAYNLGNTYYRLENFTEADKYFKQASDSLASTKYGADSYHNAGNSMLRQRNWQGAIDAYKNALRRNPDDMDTKTNLAYAQKMLENEQQNQDQDQNQDQNKDQNQDQDQNKDQNQDQNQNKDQNKDDNQNDKDQQDQQDQQNRQDRKDGGQQPKISPQAAQQMLQAIQAQEKETQDKVNREKALKLQSKQKEKNW